MAKLIVYYAHPGNRYSKINKQMARVAEETKEISFVDLYADYPRHNIDVQVEQSRLLDHDIILFQFPVFWYSSPSLIKEWQDLVLQHGFAFGKDGDKLQGKAIMLAVTTGGPEDAYSKQGYQNFPLRTFLTPFEQTAKLCGMKFVAPYVFFGALLADPETDFIHHIEGYQRLITALAEDRFDLAKAEKMKTISYKTLPIREGK